MTWDAVTDGIKTGWRVVLVRSKRTHGRCGDVPEFGELLTLGEVPAVVYVDVPSLHDHPLHQAARRW